MKRARHPGVPGLETSRQQPALASLASHAPVRVRPRDMGVTRRTVAGVTPPRTRVRPRDMAVTPAERRAARIRALEEKASNGSERAWHSLMRIRAWEAWTPKQAPPKRERPRCGARCRNGRPCQAAVVWDRTKHRPGKRCRMHGGTPLTPESRARIVEAQRRRWDRWRQERKQEVNQ